jgi:hypothetical protein
MGADFIKTEDGCVSFRERDLLQKEPEYPGKLPSPRLAQQ